MGRGSIAACIVDLGNRWRWVVSFTHHPLDPWGKGPWYPLDRMLGEPQSQSKWGAEEKNHCPYQKLNPGCPVNSLFTIPTELIYTVKVWYPIHPITYCF